MGCSTSKGVVVDTNKPAIQEFNTGDLDDIAVNLDDVDQSTHKKKKNVPAVVTNENKVEPLSDKEFLAELRIRARTEDFSATLLEKYRDLIKQEALRDSVVAVGSFGECVLFCLNFCLIFFNFLKFFHQTSRTSNRSKDSWNFLLSMASLSLKK
jgi:hypothetical protein